MKPLRKLLALQSGDRRLLLITFALLNLTRLGLRFWSFQKLWQQLVSVSQSSPFFLIGTRTASVEKITWAVEVSSRYTPGGAKCLARALTTQVLMRWHGHTPELRIGVTKDQNGQLAAHAWVEHQGKVVMGYLSELSQFTPLPSLEGDR
jgi:hypothetical protein